MTSQHAILLASSSPRRRELLLQLGVTFRVEPAGLDETRVVGESPEDYVCRMALEKALVGFKRAKGPTPVLGSDTIVLLDGDILGKPGSQSDAESMLQRLSGRTHQVCTAVALVLGPDNILDTLNITAVTFGVMPDDWIEHYCQSDEPMDKAGAYAVQGGAGQYVSRIEGSYSGVMGLPLYETASLLRQAGLLA